MGLSENRGYPQIAILMGKMVIINWNMRYTIFRQTRIPILTGWCFSSVPNSQSNLWTLWTDGNGDEATKRRFSAGKPTSLIWVCLKMGYTPNYSHLVGIMISKTIGCRGTLFSDKPISKQLQNISFFTKKNLKMVTTYKKRMNLGRPTDEWLLRFRIFMSLVMVIGGFGFWAQKLFISFHPTWERNDMEWQSTMHSSGGTKKNKKKTQPKWGKC